MITLTRVAFSAWLATLPQTEPFATARDACGCPIARYVQTLGAFQWVGVCRTKIGVQTRHRRAGIDNTPTDPWVAQYVEAIDTTYEFGPITPEQALAVLATIPEEVTA